MEDLKEKNDELMQAAMKLGEAMYKDQGEEGAEGAEASAEKDENIVDADFEEVKDDDDSKGDKKASA